MRLDRSATPGMWLDSGLYWPATETSWSQRCGDSPGLAWAFWSALRDLGVDQGLQDLDLELSGQTSGRRTVLGVVNGVTVVSGLARSGEVRVRAGRVDPHDLAPGPTIEEEEQERGVHVGADLLELEATRARRWLKGDEHLGMVALLGPMSWRLYADLRYERTRGYLGDRNELTPAGWWKLAYLARQGVSPVDRRRQQYLGRLTARAPKAGPRDYAQQRRPHLLAVQRMVLDRMRREEAIPLGIEFSAMHQYIAARHHLRPDALMLGLDPQRLIYIEYLRKVGERELSLRGQARYDRMRETLKTLAGALEVDVLLDYRSKGEQYELLYQPGRLGVRKRDLQVVGGAEQAGLFGDVDEVLVLPEDGDWDRV